MALHGFQGGEVDFTYIEADKYGYANAYKLPASLPALLTTLRQSIGTAVAVLFATRLGMGYYIYFQGSTLLNYPAMYAGVLLMSLLGLGLYFLVDELEKRLCRWKDAG